MHLSKKRIHKVSVYLEKKEAFEEGIQNPHLKNSKVYSLCSEIPYEFLLLTLAKFRKVPLVQERLIRYWQEWSPVEPFLNGRDLREMNIEEGPVYAKILQELKLARIDGETKSREDEERLARNLWERMKTLEERKNF